MEDTAGTPYVGGDNSLDTVLGFVREDYEDDFKSLDSYRTRAATLLGIAAVAVGLTAQYAGHGHGGWPMFLGLVCVLLSLVAFLYVSTSIRLRIAPLSRPLAEECLNENPTATKLQVLANTLEAVECNAKRVALVQWVHTAGLVLLAGGTLLIGIRIAVTLL